MKNLKLYWTTTKDHQHDCFLVTETATRACQLLEGAEEYEPGSATAELIIEVLPNTFEVRGGDADLKLLVAVGAVLYRRMLLNEMDPEQLPTEFANQGLIVMIGDRTFRYGDDLADNVLVGGGN